MKSLAPILGAVLAVAAIAPGQGPGRVRVMRRPSTTLSPALSTRASLQAIRVPLKTQVDGKLLHDNVVIRDPNKLAPHFMGILKDQAGGDVNFITSTGGTTGSTTATTGGSAGTGGENPTTGGPAPTTGGGSGSTPGTETAGATTSTTGATAGATTTPPGTIIGYVHFAVPSTMTLNGNVHISANFKPDPTASTPDSPDDIVFPVYSGTAWILPLVDCPPLKPSITTQPVQDSTTQPPPRWFWSVMPAQFGDSTMYMVVEAGPAKDDLKPTSSEQTRVVKVKISAKQTWFDLLTTQYRWLVGLSIVAIIGMISSWVAWARKLKKTSKPPSTS